ncbi:SusC/RagA family TonB-linked outer membrane protein [Salinimicrobium oceani]|uniref:SusC/RagA family TonB-linked outer membrane protein n=1 Tax=Salinimicrobium oceani TaxID=2722702 RepID=A0ABX1CWP1_9FLAO|nr:SusC/RagA family TonB-linked outer membrane protein [Salinimicrobium oceani]NJW52701.1 SusC/RagA family TonB-linked outer membrane protein [Salinimicrobium oceani]
MKNNYSRLVIIALITIIVFLYALTIKGYAAGLPATLQETVTGVVTDEQGMPLPGVTVTVKGSNKGTATNIDGEYKIAVDPQGVLEFSYVGFKAMEISVDGRREINVRLVEDITALDEVQINAGYYNTTRRESTGNISRVTAEEIELQPVVNPLLALQGRMAGVEIISGGAQVGAANTIRIRGINSLREEGNFPLYIIDGVPISSLPVETNSMFGSLGMDPLNGLNLSNIESIEVLKDADATAIYGSRGANGVILITTKTGKSGATGLDVRIYSGTSSFPGRLDLLETPDYLQLRRAAFQNDQVEPDQYNAYDLILWNQTRNTDWQDFFFGGTAETTDVNIAANGGSERTFFRVGGGFYDQGTIYPGDYNYKKITGSLGLNHTSRDDKLNLNLSLSYGVDKNQLLGESDVSQYAFLLPPNAPSVLNENGDLNWEDWEEAGLNNPLAGYYNNSEIRTRSLISNLNFSYSIFNNLNFKTSLGYTTYNSEELKKRPSRSYNPAEEAPHYSFHLNSYRRSWIVEPQLIFEKDFENVGLEALVGTTFQENVGSLLSLQGTGYVTETLIGNLDAAEDIEHASSPENKYRYSAFFARVGGSWKKKLFLNFTGRRDGSSRFGPNKRFSNFGAVGAAWIFTENPISDEHSSFISFGKIRGSYGATGNDQIGDYGYLDAYEATDGPQGLYPVGLSNPDFSWEVNQKLESAINVGFFNDRINLDVSWYRNLISKQLVGYPLPAITGFTSVQANLPALIENTGWEIVISTSNINTRNFQWRTNLNVTFPKNELVEYPGIEQSPYANTFKIGYPLDIGLMYQYDGLDPETGLYQFTDINNDGRLDHEDRTHIQDRGRQYFGGINNHLIYKGFTLQFLLQFAKQEGVLSFFDAGASGVQREMALEAFESGGDFQGISQSFDARTAYSNVIESDFVLQEASYLRLKTLSLGYQVPVFLLEKMGLKGGKVFLHGQNLLTLTNYDGLDPEFPYSPTSFANLRTLTGGIELNF